MVELLLAAVIGGSAVYAFVRKASGPPSTGPRRRHPAPPRGVSSVKLSHWTELERQKTLGGRSSEEVLYITAAQRWCESTMSAEELALVPNPVSPRGGRASDIGARALAYLQRFR